MSDPAPARLFVYLAAEAPIGVVLRRGPSAWTRLSRWHTDSDTFEHGQWLRGRVYERRSDLSADGELFVYFARRSGGPAPGDLADSWIALSRPPWFSALALWPVGGTYCAGGFFPAARKTNGRRRRLWLGTTGPPELGRLPTRLSLAADPPPHLDRTASWTERTVFLSRRLRDGWTPTDGAPTETWERRQPGGRLTLITTQAGFDYRAAGGPYLDDYALRVEPGAEPLALGRATWADWDQAGRLVLAREGRLFRWQPPNSLEEIADFNPQTPSPAPAPAWARSWTSGRAGGS